MMLARENLVADVDDQLVDLAVETTAGIIRVRRRLLQDRVGLDHFARHQVPADAEMLQRTLRLRTPELVRGNVHFTQAVCLFAEVVHPCLSWQLMSESTLAVLIESVRTAR
ncbi:phage tail sheath gpL-like [Bradyrhizobium sp. LM6.11]